MKKELVLALDIGSNKTKILICQKEKQRLNLLAKIEKDSEGLKEGNVVEPEKLTENLKEIFLKLEEDFGKEVRSIFLNLSSSSLFSFPSKGLVSVSRADGVISKEDVERVLKEAKAIKLPSNKEIFEILEKEFIVDGQRGIKDPVGLKGMRLEVEILALGIFYPYFKNLKDAILGADLEILDIIPSPLACSKSVLTDRQKELGVCLFEFGAQTSLLSFFKDGKMIDFLAFPFGSSEITKEIALSFRIDYDFAEKIKIEYGSCFFKGKDSKQRVEAEGEVVAFSKRRLTYIVQKTLTEIISEIHKKTKNIFKEKKLAAGLVVTGGGAKLSNLDDFLRMKLKIPCRLGFPKGIEGLENDISFSAACGILLMVAEREIIRETFLDKFKKICRKIFS